MLVIEILGAGCAKCDALEQNVRKAVDELGIEAEVRHVRDLKEIMNRGVMMTPALAINGKMVSVGKMLSVEKIKEILESKRTE